MKYLPRILEQKIIDLSRLFQVIVITGARQVGKSTLLEHLNLSQNSLIVFDPVVDIRNARQDPDLFLKNISLPAVLDEVQYAPELIPAIKRFVDKRRDEKGLFYLTGSQHFSILKNISESLAGRAAYLELFPFNLAEKYEISHKQQLVDIICNNTDEDIQLNTGCCLPEIVPNVLPLFRELWRGLYPGAIDIPDDYLHTWYESYLRTYVERDVRLLGEIKDEHMFSRFFQLLSALTAQEINYSQLGRELGIDPKTAGSWLTILERSYQWLSIPSYSPNLIKRISRKPKGYLTDTGFICYLQRISSDEVLASSPLVGHVFETFVVSEIFKQMQRIKTKPNLYHWRAHSGAEIDLIIEYNGIFSLVEIKLKSNPSLKNVQGFASFRKAYPNLRFGNNWIICAADKTYKLNRDTIVLPYNFFSTGYSF